MMIPTSATFCSQMRHNTVCFPIISIVQISSRSGNRCVSALFARVLSFDEDVRSHIKTTLEILRIGMEEKCPIWGLAWPKAMDSIDQGNHFSWLGALLPSVAGPLAGQEQPAKPLEINEKGTGENDRFSWGNMGKYGEIRSTWAKKC